MDSFLEEQAALYASGAMPGSEREHFELLLEFHEELRALVRELEEVTVAATVPAKGASVPVPSPDLKARIMGRIEQGVPQARREGFVVTSPEGVVRWVNEEFTQMCGYSVEEVRGRKLGPILQGELTDRAAAEHMRRAVHARQSCEEELINYHKDGTPYWVSIQITPIHDDRGETRWMVARERELRDKMIPA